MEKIRRETRKGTTVWLRMDASQATCPVYYSQDGVEFSVSQYQVGDVKHSWPAAFRMVRAWLSNQ